MNQGISTRKGASVPASGAIFRIRCPLPANRCPSANILTAPHFPLAPGYRVPNLGTWKSTTEDVNSTYEMEIKPFQDDGLSCTNTAACLSPDWVDWMVVESFDRIGPSKRHEVIACLRLFVFMKWVVRRF